MLADDNNNNNTSSGNGFTASELEEYYMMDGHHAQHLKRGERVLSYFKCSRINPFSNRQGELIIGENHIYFLEDQVYLMYSK